MTLETRLNEVHGVGPRFISRLERLHIKTVRDLLFHFPVRYEDFSELVTIAELEPGREVTVSGTVRDVELRRSFRRHFTIVEAVIEDTTGAVHAVWFNQPYLKDTLKPGRRVNLAGKVREKDGELVFSHPMYELVPQIHADYTQKNTEKIPHGSAPVSVKSAYVGETRHTARLVPIYPETQGLTSKGIRFVLEPVLKNLDPLDEWMPEDILETHRFPNINAALRAIHFPACIEEADRARKRFAFENLFLLQLANLEGKLSLRKERAPQIETDLALLKKIVGELPFTLTASQKSSLWEILQDLAQPHPMQRLLQGDVGSGKTAVAALAALMVAKQGYQAAFMAPTEILARQHYETLKKLFTSILAVHQPTALLTGGGAKIFYEHDIEADVKKEACREKIAAGEVRIIIGTHTLISAKSGKAIHFKNLALVIVDEQHRFGVRQRAALVDRRTDAERTRKAAESDLLYGDLTYKIRECIFNVKKQLGSGHKESIYQKALEEEFGSGGLNFEKEEIIDIRYNNKKIGVYKPDFVIENKVIVELKVLPFVGAKEESQIWHYLKGSIYKLALLVNFGTGGLTVKRIVYDTARQSASSPHSSAYVPHFLSMSATPIPRTLMLTVFGDLDLSTITELPGGRKKIITKAVAPENRMKAYTFIRGEIKKGRQAFVICPRIDPTQTGADTTQIDAEEFPRSSAFSPQLSASWDVKAVKEEYKKLSKNIFPDLRVAMLHGQLKPKEKEKMMREFQEREIDILVSTSVVEVGVDVPNASIMMIEGTDRFGLAQLYQLRGRVGRGEHQSFCFLFTDSSSKATAARLKAIVEAKNGFEFAEHDLKLRGPGEFIGEKQTGLPDIAMRGLTDPDLVKQSREAAQRVLADDSRLTTKPLLRARLQEFTARLHGE